MASSFIISERNGSVEIIRLNRPEKRNALSREMIAALAGSFIAVAKEPDLRAIILAGAGDSFCAGTDSGELTELDNDQGREVAERGQALCNQIENCGVPVIAAVNGVAAGGGCELALACHLRIAAADAQFSLPEIKLGVIPAYGGTQRLAREIGEGRALEAMLTGRTIPAAEALEFGLVNSVAPVAELLDRAQALAQEIAQLAPLAIHACLEAVTRGTQLPLDEGLALEAKLFADLFATEDVREGTSAFLEKRSPVFKGK
jgi:enoyl-CoA hydratase